MPYNKLSIGGADNDILSWANHEFSFEEQSMLRNVSRLPYLFKHVALMPDAHLGIGSMVGSVVATRDAVIPATVGVDIGCGMMAVKTPFKSGILDGKLKNLRLEIEEAIPVGFSAYGESVDESSSWEGWSGFKKLHEGVQDRKAKAMKQLGTLGGGNHFIEVCLDTENFVWLMLHSGSRNIGKELAERHISTAKSLWRLSELPSPDLAYFIKGTPEFAAYWSARRFAYWWSANYAICILCSWPARGPHRNRPMPPSPEARPRRDRRSVVPRPRPARGRQHISTLKAGYRAYGVRIMGAGKEKVYGMMESSFYLDMVMKRRNPPQK